MSSEINEIAVFTAVTAVGLVCAAIVDATPIHFVWNWMRSKAIDCYDWCIIALACWLMPNDLHKDQSDR